MNLFFGIPAENGTAVLPGEESAHCIRVLRMTTGDEIFFTDGNGNVYRGSIVEPDPKHCLVRVQETKTAFGKRNYSLHVAMAPPKSMDRFEWFLEKATEIGIHEITPLLCMRSERKQVKTERLHKVMAAAMKQSIQAYLPKLNEMVPFEKFISAAAGPCRYLCSGFSENQLKNLAPVGSPILLLIGPEGDFTADETGAAKKNNFIPVSLGPTRLRTETAGVVACTVVSLLNVEGGTIPVTES